MVDEILDERSKLKAMADGGVDQLKEPMSCSTCKQVHVDWSRLNTIVVWLSINRPNNCHVARFNLSTVHVLPARSNTLRYITSARRGITMPT